MDIPPRERTRFFGDLTLAAEDELLSGTDLEAAFLMGGLLGEEAGGEGLFHVRGDENAAEAVFGFGATMDANAAASGYLVEDG